MKPHLPKKKQDIQQMDLSDISVCLTLGFFKPSPNKKGKNSQSSFMVNFILFQNVYDEISFR